MCLAVVCVKTSFLFSGSEVMCRQNCNTSLYLCELEGHLKIISRALQKNNRIFGQKHGGLGNCQHLKREITLGNKF